MDNVVTPAQRLTLRNLKIAKFRSKETTCFEANVYFDGTFLGTAENDGNGGSTFFRNGNDEQERANEAEAWALSVRTADQGQSFDGPLVDLIDDLVFHDQAQKEILAHLKRTMKTKVLYIKNGKVWSMAHKGRKVDPLMIAECKKRNPGMPILNEMPMDRALTMWRGVQEVPA